jgi:hypothetical protein
MEFVLLAAMAVIVAILFNFGSAKLAASSLGPKFQGSYAMVTLGTALVIFLAIIASAYAMKAIGKEPTLPGA